ncbi:MAG: hypothetical protein SGPRY_013781 [Prymnesium sp.]
MESPELCREAHRAYIKRVSDDSGSFEYAVSEHLRMSGVYWAASALYLLGALDDLDGRDVVSFVMKCQHAGGGFGGNIGHDPHMLYTLSAVQILCLFDALDEVDADAVVSYIQSLQQPDGSFFGDEWGEVDTRFSYCALCCASLLGRLEKLDVASAVAFVRACENFDGGFGCVPGGESHAGQVFTCVGALAIAGGLDHCQRDLLSWWLCERQTPGGGLNGRPQKDADVCYSWWVLSALCMLERDDWLDSQALRKFIIDCQDSQAGGIADKPGDEADVFHTFFGIAGLSLLHYEDLEQIDPAYALPIKILDRVRANRKEKTPSAS